MVSSMRPSERLSVNSSMASSALCQPVHPIYASILLFRNPPLTSIFNTTQTAYDDLFQEPLKWICGPSLRGLRGVEVDLHALQDMTISCFIYFRHSLRMIVFRLSKTSLRCQASNVRGPLVDRLATNVTTVRVKSSPSAPSTELHTGMIIAASSLSITLMKQDHDVKSFHLAYPELLIRSLSCY